MPVGQAHDIPLGLNKHKSLHPPLLIAQSVFTSMQENKKYNVNHCLNPIQPGLFEIIYLHIFWLAYGISTKLNTLKKKSFNVNFNYFNTLITL